MSPESETHSALKIFPVVLVLLLLWHWLGSIEGSLPHGLLALFVLVHLLGYCFLGLLCISLISIISSSAKYHAKLKWIDWRYGWNTPLAERTIGRSASSFDVSEIPREEDPVPEADSGWLRTGKDHAKLKAYARHLDKRRASIAIRISAAAGKFRGDRRRLVAQQASILRLAINAKPSISNLQGLPNIDLTSRESAPQYQRMLVPPEPPESSAPAFLRNYRLVPGGVAIQVGQAFGPSGSGGNILAAIVAIAAAAIYEKSMLSKALRMLEMARGENIAFYEEARGFILTLGTSHDEIVRSSQRLTKAARDLREIRDRVAASVPKSVTRLEDLDPAARRDASDLWQWILCAEAIHSKVSV